MNSNLIEIAFVFARVALEMQQKAGRSTKRSQVSQVCHMCPTSCKLCRRSRRSEGEDFVGAVQRTVAETLGPPEKAQATKAVKVAKQTCLF